MPRQVESGEARKQQDEDQDAHKPVMHSEEASVPNDLHSKVETVVGERFTYLLQWASLRN